MAIKLALPSEQGFEWMERERRLQGVARGVVPLLDHGTHEGRPFLVLPWVEHDLHGWLYAGPSTLADKLRVLRGAARALYDLHRSPAEEVLVHYDVKPTNFLVSGDAEVWLSDMGGAHGGPALARRRDTVRYTPGYAALEQLLPLERRRDTSVDVHALGVTIYSVLAGKEPDAKVDPERLLTRAGSQLRLLYLDDDRTPDEEEEYQALSRQPLGTLVELEAACALAPADERRLRVRLEDSLSGPDAAHEAERIFEALRPALLAALAPGPEQRQASAHPLLAALDDALAVVWPLYR